jgi:hypothetical protein
MNPKREIVPLYAADASTFCKNLRQHLNEAGLSAPGHLTLLNMLARSAGHRNYQSLRAAPPAGTLLPDAPAPVPAPSKAPRLKALCLPRGNNAPPLIRKAIGQFDVQGRLMRWPTQFAVQQLAIWALWTRLPGKKSMTEREVNEYLDRQNTFGDPVTLRRELINAGLMTRTVDCRDYRKAARQPDATSATFLAAYFGAIKG